MLLMQAVLMAVGTLVVVTAASAGHGGAVGPMRSAVMEARNYRLRTEPPGSASHRIARRPAVPVQR